MKIRLIENNDFHLHYLDLLSQLSSIDKENISYENFCQYINNHDNYHRIYVVEIDNKIVGTGTLLIENKIIHNFGKVAHIEDVVVDQNKRNLGIGKTLIQYLINIAENIGCYKIILNSNEKNINFYQKCGFVQKEYQMVKYF